MTRPPLTPSVQPISARAGRDGNAGPSRKMSAALVRPVRRHWLTSLLVAATMAGIAYGAGKFVEQELRLREQWRESATLQRQLEAAAERNRVLRQEIVRLNDLDYVETVARQQLGLIKPGEIPYMALEAETAE